MNRRVLEAKYKKRPGLGFAEPVQPDESLSAVVGASPAPRSELIKRLWEYIRLHELQDKHRQMIINADDKLRALFNGKSQVSVIELMKLISGHSVPAAGT